jgi:hypothetical protein
MTSMAKLSFQCSVSPSMCMGDAVYLLSGGKFSKVVGNKIRRRGEPEELEIKDYNWNNGKAEERKRGVTVCNYHVDFANSLSRALHPVDDCFFGGNIECSPNSSGSVAFR